MDNGFAGDPFHEGGSQPMSGLKGGMVGAHTQMPQESTSMDNPRSAAPDNIGQTWSATSLNGDHPTTGSNDARKAH